MTAFISATAQFGKLNERGNDYILAKPEALSPGGDPSAFTFECRVPSVTK